ncbi:hypothetical protein GY45DRAFT_1330415 [Cubamyces sp. BRFM 1775]|nr:hypothetical protein GY45DRAFT_1330415 [Cubamyces sp. BRFM 1775]
MKGAIARSACVGSRVYPLQIMDSRSDAVCRRRTHMRARWAIESWVARRIIRESACVVLRG